MFSNDVKSHEHVILDLERYLDKLERRTNRVERPGTFMNIPFERTGTLTNKTNMTLNDDIRDMNM